MKVSQFGRLYSKQCSKSNPYQDHTFGRQGMNAIYIHISTDINCIGSCTEVRNQIPSLLLSILQSYGC